MSRPKRYVNGTIEEYFKNLGEIEAKEMLQHQIETIRNSLTSQLYNFTTIFVNVERYLLLDGEVVDNIEVLNREAKKHNRNIILEITERHKSLDLAVKQVFNRLILNDVVFAADDYCEADGTHQYINDYHFIKIDISGILICLELDSNVLLNKLYSLKASGIKIIAEKIETKKDFHLAKSLPIDLFQGHYFLSEN